MVDADGRVLVLGGTSEASALARALVADGVGGVVTSFAGRTSAPRAPAGRTRVGGFGGPEGLERYLRAERVDVLVDATHPFAARMRWNAAAAGAAAGVPRVRLERPPWSPPPGADWRPVPDLDAAADAVRGFRRAFLTTGRSHLEPFARIEGVRFVVRSVEPPSPGALPGAEVIVARGPFGLDQERALLGRLRIDVLVTKNSGGRATRPKLDAAAELGVPIVVVERPPNPPGPTVGTVGEAVAFVRDALGGHPGPTRGASGASTPTAARPRR